MKSSIKSGSTILTIFYKNGEFSNNLFCSNLWVNKIPGINVIEFDFNSVIKTRGESNSKDDLEYLFNNYTELDIIQFSDSTVFRKLSKYFHQSEPIKIKINGARVIELLTEIEFIEDNGTNLIVKS